MTPESQQKSSRKSMQCLANLFFSNYTERDVVTARIGNGQDLCIHTRKAKTGALLNQIMFSRAKSNSSMQQLRFIGLFFRKSKGCC